MAGVCGTIPWETEAGQWQFQIQPAQYNKLKASFCILKP